MFWRYKPETSKELDVITMLHSFLTELATKSQFLEKVRASGATFNIYYIINSDNYSFGEIFDVSIITLLAELKICLDIEFFNDFLKSD